MRRVFRFANALLLGAALIAPIALRAQDRDHDRDDRTIGASMIPVIAIITTGMAMRIKPIGSGTARPTTDVPIGIIGN